MPDDRPPGSPRVGPGSTGSTASERAVVPRPMDRAQVVGRKPVSEVPSHESAVGITPTQTVIR